MIWLIVALVIALAANVILGWYCFRVADDMYYISNELEELVERTEEYSGHIKILYELPTFYGDETLKNMLRHSKSYEKYLKSFMKEANLMFSSYESEEYEEMEDYEEEDDTGKEKITRTGKTVFYGGT